MLALEANVKDFNSQQQAVKKVIEKFGELDVLIANAGVGIFAPIDELDIEQWNETIDTNLTGVFYSIKAAIDALKKQKGYIITISSLAGTNFFAGASAYNVRKYGIKVTTIMPGSVATEFGDQQNDESKNAWKIQPEDIGKLVVDLLNMHPRTLPSKVEVRPAEPK